MINIFHGMRPVAMFKHHFIRTGLWLHPKMTLMSRYVTEGKRGESEESEGGEYSLGTDDNAIRMSGDASARR